MTYYVHVYSDQNKTVSLSKLNATNVSSNETYVMTVIGHTCLISFGIEFQKKNAKERATTECCLTVGMSMEKKHNV